MTPTFNNPDQAFDTAISSRRLSADPTSSLFAGHWMYMGTVNGVDTFKHSETRRYLTELD